MESMEIETVHIKVEPFDPEEYEKVARETLESEIDLDTEVKVEIEEDTGDLQPLSYDDNMTFIAQPNITVEDLKKENLELEDEKMQSSTSSESDEDEDFEKTLTGKQRTKLNIKSHKRTPKSHKRTLKSNKRTLKSHKRTLKSHKSKKSKLKLFEYPSQVENMIDKVTLSEEERSIDFRLTLEDRKSKSEYVCELCATAFVSGVNLASHQQMHTEQYGDHKCDICNWHLTSAESLKTHRQNHYIRYQCKECHENFTSKEQALCHVNDIHIGLAFTCPYPSCSQEFKRPFDLQVHWERHMSMFKYFKCQYCGCTFKNQKLLNNHCKKLHKTHTLSLPCPECGVTFSSARDLVKHRNQAHDWAGQDSDMFSCELCDDRHFPTRLRLNQHIRRMHTGRVKRLECDHCGNMFHSKPELRGHIQWSHMGGLGAWACACGRVFRTRHRLLVHAQVHANKAVEKTLPCPICGKMFESNYLLKRHIKRHTNDVKYPCPACDMKFKDRSYVQVHYKIKHLNMTREEINAAKNKRRPMTIDKCSKIQRVITVEEVRALAGVDGVLEILPEAEKPTEFPCDQCGKVCKTNALLRRHLKVVHTDVTYPCPECDMRFKDQRYVKVHHMIKHLNMSRADIEREKNNGKEREKRFGCSDCSKKFVTKSLLRRHSNIHIDAIHPCPECGVKFKDAKYVPKHYKIKHPDLEWNDELDKLFKEKSKKMNKLKLRDSDVEFVTVKEEFQDSDEDIEIVNDKPEAIVIDDDESDDGSQALDESSDETEATAQKSKESKEINDLEVKVPLFDTFESILSY